MVPYWYGPDRPGYVAREPELGFDQRFLFAMAAPFVERAHGRWLKRTPGGRMLIRDHPERGASCTSALNLSGSKTTARATGR